MHKILRFKEKGTAENELNPVTSKNDEAVFAIEARQVLLEVVLHNDKINKGVVPFMLSGVCVLVFAYMCVSPYALSSYTRTE